MKQVPFFLLAVIVLGGCNRKDAAKSPAGGDPADQVSLGEARRGFQTKLIRQDAEKEAAPEPPAGLFRSVRYESPAGKLAAYVSVPPKGGRKHPAVVWLTGGFSNSIGDNAWEPADPKNDQSASAFRKAGVMMMYPSLRGGNDNPGFKEGYFGEVDDVIAAVDYLAKQDFVDPKRIYLGGHSTGGSLALLVAESTDRLRAVFSFGPVEDVSGYGPKYLPFPINDPQERKLRAPVRWLHSIRNPVFVFEGTEGNANIDSLRAIGRASANPLVKCYPVKGADHFSILAPVTRLIAGKILRDDGAECNIAFTEQEVMNAMRR